MKKTILILTLSLLNSICFSQSFNEFWMDFQKNMDSKEYSLTNISFPYFYNCSYFSEGGGEISIDMFKESGPEIFINGNAYISNSLSNRIFPTSNDLSIKAYDGGYMDDYLKSMFLNTHKDLNEIHVVSEKGNENDAIGYKAYFKKIAGSYKFIGFEAYEFGD